VTTLTLTAKDAASLRVDALVVGVVSTPDGPRLLAAADLPKELRNRLGPVLAPLGLAGAPDEVRKVPGMGVTAPVVVLTGVGPVTKGAPAPEAVRRGVGAALRELAGTARVGLALPATTAGQVAVLAEGALLGAYAYSEYKKRSASPAPVGEVVLVTSLARDGAAAAAVKRAVVLADAVAGTRDLVNCPPVDLYPESFADIAVAAAKEGGLSVRVLDERQLRRGGYGGLTGVGQGSPRGPRLVRVSYSPKRARTASKAKHLALVGKGITFDSGGLSIKPAAAMETMKCDMAGAAAVLHTVLAVARLGLPVNVTAWLCLAENMPSGTAQRPSDVITCYGGRTVEVLNTDAEGRLVLADGLVAASEEKPDVLLDVATLTGAQVVALGNRVSAVMSPDDDLRARIPRVAEAVGEQFWPMPLPEELRSSMDSAVADIANIGDRMGGMLVAGLFLREFVGTLDGTPDGTPIPWAHLDIAGPAFNDGKPHGYTGKGGTGVAVRTLVGLAEDLAT